MDVIQRFRASGGTIVLISHVARDITTLCDKAFLLQNHKIAASGDPNDVMQTYLAATAA